MSVLVLKSGTIIDGTGAPRFQGDILVKDGRIRQVGGRVAGAGEVIDASGLIVAPGIIDPHTHLDAQLLYEQQGRASSWHGVTTVVTGLCGYTLAPCRPEHRDYLLRMFSRVEEMPLKVLQIGVPWTWVTFPEYLDSLDRGLGVNVAPFLGHSALRYYVMGPESVERAATADEIKAMRGVLRESIEAGAFGFTTSRSFTKSDANLKPVPSRMATFEEDVQLAEELRHVGATGMGLNAEGLFSGLTDGDRDVIREMTRVSDKPIQVNAAAKHPDLMDSLAAEGLTLWASVPSQPFYRYIDLYRGTNTFNGMDTWLMIAEKPLEERRRLYGAPELRQKLRAEVDAEPALDARTMRRPRLHWDTLTVARAARAENRHLEGLSIAELAKRQRKHLADAILDLAVAEDLRTEFLNRFQKEADFFTEAMASTYRHPNVVPLNSDAGAHLRSECKAGDGTYFLRRWVIDRGIMSLEEGVRKLTSVPARMMGLSDRGVLKEGAAADIVVFDPARLDCLAKEPVADLPGGEERWVQKAAGISFVIVNGRVTLRDGKEAGELPGKVLRSGWYR